MCACRTRRRRMIVGCCGKIRRRTGYRAFSTVRQLDDDQPRTASRPPINDRKAVAVQRMTRINNSDLSNSPVKRRGISICSAIPPWPMPFRIVSCTLLIVSNCAASRCAKGRPRITSWLDPATIAMARSAQPTATPSRPTSIGTAGRLQLDWVADIRSESPADFSGMFEGSTRSREAMHADGKARDVVEAGLNEAAVDREVYGR